MKESAGSRHHLPRLVGLQGLEYDGGVVLEYFLERRAQRLLLRNRKHGLCTVIQTDNALLFVHDDDRILHVLKHSLVGQGRKFHDALSHDQPDIDRQHSREYQRHEGNHVGANSEVVGRRRDQGTNACRHQQKQATPVGGRHRRTMHQQSKYRSGDERVAVWRVHEHKPRTPVVRASEILPVFIDGGQLPHEFVILVCCSEGNGDHRYDQQQHDCSQRRSHAGVFAKTNECREGQQCRTDEMTGPADREYQERFRHQFHGAAHHPEADNHEQHADRHAADLALGQDQAYAEQQVARCAKDQQDGQCDVQVHDGLFELTITAGNATGANTLIPGTVSQLLKCVSGRFVAQFTIWRGLWSWGLNKRLFFMGFFVERHTT